MSIPTSRKTASKTFVTIDRDSAARLGLSARDVDNALYDGFGQRQVATIYDELNQYHVVMEVAPRFARSPEALKDVYVPGQRQCRRQRSHKVAQPARSSIRHCAIHPADRH